MRLWLDDDLMNPDTPDRHAPLDYELGCARSQEAINFVKMGIITHVSFDHDLGEPNNGNGYDLAKVIEEGAFRNEIHRMTWDIHSANPAGRKNIVAAMKAAERFWAKWEKISARNS